MMEKMILEKPELLKLNSVFNSYLVAKTSNALSTMLNDSFVHEINIMENGIEKINNMKIDPDTMEICSVNLQGTGDTELTILYTIKIKYAKKIASVLLGQEVSSMDEMGKSAVSEVGNIMTGSFFNALSEGTGFKVNLSTPLFSEDSLFSAVNNTAKKVILPVDNVILTDILYEGKDTGIKLHMLIFQDVHNARKIIGTNKEVN